MCTFSGPDNMFLNGCPMCGYSAPKTEQRKYTKIKPPAEEAEPLPFWIYFAGFAVLAGLIALFSYLLMR